MKELYRKYRPRKFAGVYGQDDVIRTLRNKCGTNTIPHAILLYGPYGTGKTTIARIIAWHLKCGRLDLTEKNAADYRGIEEIRTIRATIRQAPIHGPVRVWLLDEVHKATSDAQNAMLKLLEDPPEHAYFILATTEPERLLAGIRQRCLALRLKPLSQKAIRHIVQRVCTKEKINIPQAVMDKLVEFAGGSGREALQILDRIYQLDSESYQLAAITGVSARTQTIEIARLLMRTGTKWRDLLPILRNLQHEDPEQIRYMVLGYAKTVLLAKNNARAFRLIEAFRDNFYDSKFCGIISACYEVLQG
jgi:DNA polymerase-3 subunit gamma/tau